MNIGRAFKAVAWSFFGVRKNSDYERDVAELKPQHVIVVGIVCAALFVGVLVALVNWIIGSGVAAA
ncbi:MAG: DUF2970 domain-containing protein [Aquincola sp.]|nr:DUF2970 domain-containing protein [Aquincola sp.]